jgi:two-component system OmpR family sensor kinase
VNSLRWTTLAWIGAVLIGTGSIGAALAYYAGLKEAACFLDGELAQIAHHVGDGDVRVLSATRRIAPEDELVIQIWDADGKLLKATGGVDLPRQADNGYANVTFAGVAWRILTTSDGPKTLQIGQRQEVRDELAEHLAMSAALPVLAAIPLSWAILAWSLKRILGRLDRLSREMARRSVASSEPLPTNEAPMEVRPLVGAMNDLLVRQRSALIQQRRFVSDAAHEMRTPLTAVQLLVDTLRERDEKEGRPGTPVLTELTVAVRRSRALTDQLLKLARVEVGEASRTPAHVELDELLSAVVAGHVTQASRKNIELSLYIRQAVTVPGTEIDLTSLLSNLVDNALRYTPEQGSVAVSLGASPGAAEIEIADTGIGIPPDALPRIYDRFYRAAGQEIEGSGLGLSIAQAIAEKYGLGLSIINRASGGVIARVRFPETTITVARAEPEKMSA